MTDDSIQQNIGRTKKSPVTGYARKWCIYLPTLHFMSFISKSAECHISKNHDSRESMVIKVCIDNEKKLLSQKQFILSRPKN